MKIAVLVSNPCVIDARVIRISEAEKKLGYEVKVFAILKDNVSTKEEKNGVLYERLKWDLSAYCRQYIPKFVKHRKIKGFLVKRLAKYLRYFSFRETFLEKVLEYKPDIVHAHDLLTLPLGAQIKELIGSKLIYDAHELEVYRNPPMPWHQKNFTKYLEKKYAKKADCIITVNDSIARILEKNLSRKQPVYTIRNTPILDSYKGKSLREKLNFSDKEKILIYVGKVSSNRGLEWVIEVLQQMPEIHFICVGHQDKQIADNLQIMSKKYNVENRVHLLPPVPHTEVVEFVKDANIGICAINPVTKSYYYSLPNKVFEMSMAGLPVIATDLPEIKNFLDQIDNGYYFTPDKKEKIVSLVQEILKKIENNPEQFNNIATKARTHRWENESKKLVEVLNACSENKNK